MSRDWERELAEALSAKEMAGQLRSRGAGLGSAPECLLDFGSNDYLGLRGHASVIEALHRSRCLGSGASPVLRGYTPEHRCLEEQLASWGGFPAALVFSSGYAANVGTLACLATSGDLLLSDELNHASLIDGCRLSKSCVHIFPHGDAEHVYAFLNRHREQYRRVLIVTESVFSMDGDRADLASLADLADRFGCGLIVDEAHAAGIYGKAGSGWIEELGLQDQVLAKLGTLSKALGSIGGYVCGSRLLIEYLVNDCRSYIFSTAPSVAVVTATRAALDVLVSMESARRQLRVQARQLRARLRSQGWNLLQAAGADASDDSPIIPVILGAERIALGVSQRLRKAGVYVPAIRPPSVPPGSSRLRISLSSSHTAEQVEVLLQALGRAEQWG